MAPYHPTDPVQEDTFGLRSFRGPVGPTLGVSQFVAVPRAPQGRGFFELVNAKQIGDSGFAISSPETTPKK